MGTGETLRISGIWSGGHEEYRKIRYLYKDMTLAMLELFLLMGNAYNRELTAWEKTEQVQKLKEALRRARDEEGLEIPGKLRDVVVDIMNESSFGIARMYHIHIHNHAELEIKEEFRKGNLDFCVAYEEAKLPVGEQKEVPYEREEIGSLEKVASFAKKILARADREYLLVISIDSANKPTAVDSV